MKRAALLLLLLGVTGCRSLEFWAAGILGHTDVLPWQARAEWGPEDVAVGSCPTGLPNARLTAADLTVPPAATGSAPILILTFESPPVGTLPLYALGVGPLRCLATGAEVLRVKDTDGKTLALRLWLEAWPVVPAAPRAYPVPVARLRGRAWME